MAAAYDHLFKVLFYGPAESGKTTALKQLAKEPVPTSYQATIGVEFKAKMLDVSRDKSVKLQVWDAAGQERFQTITKSYFRGSHILAVFLDASANNTNNRRKTTQELRSELKEVISNLEANMGAREKVAHSLIVRVGENASQTSIDEIIGALADELKRQTDSNFPTIYVVSKHYAVCKAVYVKASGYDISYKADTALATRTNKGTAIDNIMQLEAERALDKGLGLAPIWASPHSGADASSSSSSSDSKPHARPASFSASLLINTWLLPSVPAMFKGESYHQLQYVKSQAFSLFHNQASRSDKIADEALKFRVADAIKTLHKDVNKNLDTDEQFSHARLWYLALYGMVSHETRDVFARQGVTEALQTDIADGLAELDEERGLFYGSPAASSSSSS